GRAADGVAGEPVADEGRGVDVERGVDAGDDAVDRRLRLDRRDARRRRVAREREEMAVGGEREGALRARRAREGERRVAPARRRGEGEGVVRDVRERAVEVVLLEEDRGGGVAQRSA